MHHRIDARTEQVEPEPEKIYKDRVMREMQEQQERRVKMQPGAIYEEKIVSKWIIVVLLSIAGSMLFLLAYQVLIEPLGSEPAPNWFYLIMFLLFLGIAFTFGRLIIRMTPASIFVGFGPLGHNIAWDNVEDCFLDETSAARYGGAGVRTVRIGGHWRIIYNIVESSRVGLSLREGRFRDIVFSTRHPEDVMTTIKEWAHIREE
ncbi:MAG: hypothetical protein HXS52_03120 [Theionarchaea archaeon]|nr:hypothetical protein [Theionarchaea archaeon]